MASRTPRMEPSPTMMPGELMFCVSHSSFNYIMKISENTSRRIVYGQHKLTYQHTDALYLTGACQLLIDHIG